MQGVICAVTRGKARRGVQSDKRRGGRRDRMKKGEKGIEYPRPSLKEKGVRLLCTRGRQEALYIFSLLAFAPFHIFSCHVAQWGLNDVVREAEWIFSE